MPIYEYECRVCGHRFEAIQAFIDMHLEECPKCRKMELYRVISVPGILENFDSYYETDIGNLPIYIRTKQDLKDAVARHNDGAEADKMGKLAVYDGIRTDRAKRGEG